MPSCYFTILTSLHNPQTPFFHSLESKASISLSPPLWEPNQTPAASFYFSLTTISSTLFFISRFQNNHLSLSLSLYQSKQLYIFPSSTPHNKQTSIHSLFLSSPLNKMADRVYPSSKPATNGTAAATATTTNGAFPATKAQLYGATRPAYRPQPHNRRRHHSRSCCCSCCIWLTFFLLLLILLVAIAGAIVYVLYRPHRPTFSVTSLKVSYLNVTSSSTINSKFDLSITANNPNKKLDYIYDTITVSLLSNDIDIGDSTIPAFVQGKKDTTLLKADITNTGKTLDSGSVSSLKTDLKSKSGIPLKIEIDTKVKAKMGGLKTPKVGIRVTCDGITATVPTGKKAATATTSASKCKVDMRIKIWKWTF